MDGGAVKITGLTLADFQKIVADIGCEVYHGNLIVNRDASETHAQSCVARVKVRDADGAGSRRGKGGRNQAAACWHAYRDVLHEVFVRFPDAKIDTMMAVYDGMSGFLWRYPETADANIGSPQEPQHLSDLCSCGNDIVWPRWLP